MVSPVSQLRRRGKLVIEIIINEKANNSGNKLN